MYRVLSKAVQKTPFELWTDGKPGLRHLHVWVVCHRLEYIFHWKKKLDARTISGYFNDYPKK